MMQQVMCFIISRLVEIKGLNNQVIENMVGRIWLLRFELISYIWTDAVSPLGKMDMYVGFWYHFP